MHRLVYRGGDTHSHLGSVAAAGALAGGAGVLAEAAWAHVAVRLNHGRPYVFAVDVMVQRMARRLVGHKLGKRATTIVICAARAGYGPGWALAWSLATANRRHSPATDVVGLAGIIWIFELSFLPVVGATPPLRQWPLRDVIGDLMQCVIFATVTAGVLAAMDRAAGTP